RGVFDNPYAGDSAGLVYVHESGSSYLDTDGVTNLTPYAESGPVELSDGEVVMDVLGLIPDEGSSGSVQYKIYTSLYPKGSETERGPFTSGQKVDTRFAGRLVRLRVEHVSGEWRHGGLRLLVRPGGRR
ncbi:MAG TPA: hypothetical protein VKA48_01435, partial [Gammaproteobacteria bacterium]|nr:hypothetical protein [Gammaproteobacteria bacterium]